MKKLFWVNSILILLLLLCSCATIYTQQEQEEIYSLAVQLAEKQNAAGDYFSALETYNKALSQIDDYRLVYNKSIFLFENNNPLDAAKLCGKAIEDYPEQKELFLNARAYYLTQGCLYEQALESYQELVDSYPENKEYLYSLAESLIKNNQTELALEIVQKLWNEKNFDLRTASLLYELDPEKWSVVYRSFTEEEPDQTELPQE